MFTTVMQRAIAWLLLGLFVWAFLAVRTRHKADGEGRIRGPVFWLAYGLRAAWWACRDRYAARGDADAEEDGDDVADADVVDGAGNARGQAEETSQGRRAVTQRAATTGTTATRQAATRVADRDNAQVARDTDRDMAATGDTTTRSVGWRQRVAAAFDVLRHPDTHPGDAVSRVAVASPPPAASPTVTPTEGGALDTPTLDAPDQPVDRPAAEVDDAAAPMRVIVHYVGPGSWTGDVVTTAADGTRIVQRYLMATRERYSVTDHLSTSPSTGSRPAGPPPSADPVALPAGVQKLEPKEVRQQWLRAVTALGRFTDAEIAEMYQEKWGLGQRSLQRDRRAAQNDDDRDATETGRSDDTAR